MKIEPQDSGYYELVIDENWSTGFYLVPPGQKVNRSDLKTYPELDPNQYYDIKLPTGAVFVGCKVEILTDSYHGRGEMDESYSVSKAFFIANDLEIRLKTRFMLRPNEAVTRERREADKQQKRARVLNELLMQREKLDERIKNLSGGD